MRCRIERPRGPAVDTLGPRRVAIAAVLPDVQRRMRFMALSSRRLTTSTLATACALAGLVSCSDRLGPGTSRAGRLGIAPRYESAAAGVVDVAAVRVRLISTFNGDVALDTVIAFPAGVDSVGLGFAVNMEQPTEEFALFLRLIGPAGDTVFTSGPDVVRPATGGAAPPVVEPLVTY